MADKQEFEQLVKEHFAIMYTVAVRYTKNREDAEDVVAESCLSAWKKFATLKDKSKFKPWILRIITNQYLNQYRSNKHRQSNISPADMDREEEDFSLFEALSSPFLLYKHNPEKMFVQKMLAKDIKKAIDKLPDHFRVVFTLCELQNLTYQETANILDLPVGTVRSRLSRAKSRLQKSLYEWSKQSKKGGE